MTTQKLQILIDAQDKASAKIEGIRGSLAGMQQSMKKVGIAATVMGAALAIGIKKVVTSSSNLSESINAVNVIFGEGAKTILEFGENSAKSVGLSNSAFNQLASTTGALLKDTGIPLTEVAEITTELAIRAADMASVMNTDVEDAMSAIAQAMRGETEAIRKYTADVTDATLEQYRLAKGLAMPVSEMDQQAKKLLRVDVLMEQTNKFAGDFKNTSDELANSQRTLNAELEDLSAIIGTSLEPTMLTLVELADKVVVKTSDWVKENQGLLDTLAPWVIGLTGVLLVLGLLATMIAVGGPIGGPLILLAAAVVTIGAAFAFVTGEVKKTIEMIKNFGGGSFWGGMEKMSGGIAGWMDSKLGLVKGSRQFGGYIPETGLYQLHKGENVIPSSGKGGNTFNFDFSGANIVDKDNFIRQITKSLNRGAKLASMGI